MPDTRTIQVSGHGEVEVSPDTAVINLGVVGREPEAKEAMWAAGAAMQRVVDALRDRGVEATDIQTSSLNLHLETSEQTYVAGHQLVVRTDRVDEAADLLDAAIAAGANSSGGIHFGVRDQREAEDRAVAMAIDNARHRAETAAAALGVRVLEVQTVNVHTHQMGLSEYGPFQPRAARTRGNAPTPVQTGQLRIAIDVNVTFGIE